MKRLAVLAGLAGALALPASALATNSIAVSKVSYSGYVPYVDVTATADAPCAVDTCRWYAAIRIASSAEGCATTNETPFTGRLESGGGGQRSYAARYPTSTGARTEYACLVLYDTDSETAKSVASVAYTVPPQGQTYTPPAGGAPSTSTPAASAPAAAPPAAKTPTSGQSSPSKSAPTFSRAAAGRKLNRALARRYGRRWTRARSRSVNCTAVTIRTFRCVAKFGGRTVRARVTRKTVKYTK